MHPMVVMVVRVRPTASVVLGVGVAYAGVAVVFVLVTHARA
ncbi:MAG: hypothetical protein WA747_04045 [Steroidobacteraceae bacterium]